MEIRRPIVPWMRGSIAGPATKPPTQGPIHQQTLGDSASNNYRADFTDSSCCLRSGNRGPRLYRRRRPLLTLNRCCTASARQPIMQVNCLTRNIVSQLGTDYQGSMVKRHGDHGYTTVMVKICNCILATGVRITCVVQRIVDLTYAH